MKEKPVDLNNMDSLASLSKEMLANLVISLNQKVQEDSREIATLKELKRLREVGPFVPQSERTGYLFNELEATAFLEDLLPERKVVVKAHTRKVANHTTVLPPDTPVVTVDHTADAQQTIVRDGVAYVRCGDRTVERIGMRPASRYVERHVYPKYRLRDWEAEAGDTDRNTVVEWRNKDTDTLIAGAGLVASVAVSKYADALPLYRQEHMFARDGLGFSRQLLCGWLLRYHRLLAPLAGVLQRTVLSCALVNMDETPVQVLNLPGERTSTTCFMLVRVGTSADGTHRTVLFDYLQDRRKDTMAQYFPKGNDTWVMTDGLKQYLGMGERHLCCWVHARRMFKNVLKANSSVKYARTMVGLIDGLYRIEDRLREQYANDTQGFLDRRKELCGLAFTEINAHLDAGQPVFPQQSLTGKAIAYCRTYWDLLVRYPECSLSTPDNNIAENAIRPMCVGKKNWLFSCSEDGAKASAFYYSLIETAKANGMNEHSYLWYVMEKAPDCKCSGDWEQLMPWNITQAMLGEVTQLADLCKPDPERTEPYVIRGTK